MTADERRAIHAAMVRFSDGDRSAFRDVFDGLWPILVALTTRALPNRADAEDAAQRAMLKVFDRIVDLDHSRDGVGWAITIAGFETLTIRRQYQRRREDGHSIPGPEVADPAALAIDQILDAELAATLRAMIDELPARDRDALSELLLGDKPVGEAARKRRLRAVERLRSMWRKAHG